MILLEEQFHFIMEQISLDPNDSRQLHEKDVSSSEPVLTGVFWQRGN